jgi:hypothetical protein
MGFASVLLTFNVGFATVFVEVNLTVISAPVFRT